MTKELSRNGKFTSIETFITRAEKQHGDKYDYSLVQYRTLKDKITIICPVHGNFEQTPKLHLRQGCKKCGVEHRASNRRHTLTAFIDKATIVHDSKYNYSEVVYKNSGSYVDIKCPEHGLFSQVANAHLQGQGCPTCGLLDQVTSRNFCGGWRHSEWEASGNNSANFVGFQLYIIRCWNDAEEFIKVGKTYRPLAKRFCTSAEMPYNYQILKHIFGTASEISKLEDTLQKEAKEHKYIPKIQFAGKTECFSTTIQELLIDLVPDKFIPAPAG